MDLPGRWEPNQKTVPCKASPINSGSSPGITDRSGEDAVEMGVAGGTRTAERKEGGARRGGGNPVGRWGTGLTSLGCTSPILHLQLHPLPPSLPLSLSLFAFSHSSPPPSFSLHSVCSVGTLSIGLHRVSSLYPPLHECLVANKAILPGLESEVAALRPSLAVSLSRRELFVLLSCSFPGSGFLPDLKFLHLIVIIRSSSFLFLDPPITPPIVFLRRSPSPFSQGASPLISDASHLCHRSIHRPRQSWL